MRQYGRGEKFTRLQRMSSASVNLPSGLVFSMRLSPMVVPSTVSALLLLDVRRGECATQTALRVCCEAMFAL